MGGRVPLELIAGRVERCRDLAAAERELLTFLSAAEHASGARLVPLACHRPLVRLMVDRHALRGSRVLDELERHAKRVVQPEGGFAR